MKNTRQIEERIEIYKAQIEDWRGVILSHDKEIDYSTRQLYRAMIRTNELLIGELEWTLK